jgi:phage shock protein E
MMSKKIKDGIFYVLSVVFILVLFLNWSGRINIASAKAIISARNSGFNNISPKEAKIRLENESSVILLDVRTVEEYKASHIKDSLLIPLNTLEKEVGNKLTDKDAPIFIYCRSGNRSVTAARILVKQGYTNVYNHGGINSWPYEVVK